MYNYHSKLLGNEIWEEYKAISSCNVQEKHIDINKDEKHICDLYAIVQSVESLL